MGGLFDWFWEFLYGISKSIFRIIDGLMSCANKLCGVETVTINEEEVDFLTYLLTQNKVMFAFEVATIVGIVLVGVFAIFRIIKSMTTQNGLTPWQIFVKAFKTILTFLFVPVCMIAFVLFSTVIMTTLYDAVLGDSVGGIGRFLIGAFSQDGLRSGVPPDFYLNPDFNYMSTSQMWGYVNLSDFDFIFSWIAGLCILITLGRTLLMFVDRAISLVLLFIASPISISTAVVDDGARFKLWRDQVLVKFITGFGCIIGLNIYMLVVALISDGSVVFFQDSFLNNLMKIAFIIGGAVSMNRLMALIGNLVSAGAGSNELRDNAIANAGFKTAIGSALGTAGKVLSAPFKATKSAANFIRDMKQFGVAPTLGSAMGFKTSRDYGGLSKTQQQIYNDRLAKKEASRMRINNDFAAKVGDSVANAISGGSGDNHSGNLASMKKDNPGSDMIKNSIMGGQKNEKNK